MMSGARTLVSFAALLASGVACALPTGGAVTSGNATVQRPTTGINVTNTTSRSAIKWESFNVTPGSGVTVIQPQPGVSRHAIDKPPQEFFGRLVPAGQTKASSPAPAAVKFAAPLEYRLEGMSVDPRVLQLPATAATGIQQSADGVFRFVGPTPLPATGQ